MYEIDLFEWDISYTDFVDWVEEQGAEVYAVSNVNHKNSFYRFIKEEDLVAFKLKFSKAGKWPFETGFSGSSMESRDHYISDYEKTDSNK
jgi:hypothetical protein